MTTICGSCKTQAVRHEGRCTNSAFVQVVSNPGPLLKDWLLICDCEGCPPKGR